jgi:uncharacterized damage-inducible protein DinB
LQERLAAFKSHISEGDRRVEDPLVETWMIHNRINLYLLEGVTEDGLRAALKPKSRTVYDLFAHIHNVRLMWLKVAAPQLMDGLVKLETQVIGTREQLSKALESSGQAIATLLQDSFASGGKVKGSKPHTAAFFAYLISHESHHRGQIEYVLRLAGCPIDDKVSYGMWEWGVR